MSMTTTTTSVHAYSVYSYIHTEVFPDNNASLYVACVYNNYESRVCTIFVNVSGKCQVDSVL